MSQQQSALERELAYHEKLYSGFAQRHFAKSAVRAMRRHLVSRILDLSGVGRDSTVLSLGCGIGDTELLLAPHVAQITGIDLSPKAIQQARSDADRLGIRNAEFLETAEIPQGRAYDLVIAVFFLHHLPDVPLAALPGGILTVLKPRACFYSLDPSRDRLSGAVGRMLIPWIMRRYQTHDERELNADATAALFEAAGFDVRVGFYDFGSTPFAGLFPSWAGGYQLARRFDDVLMKSPALARRGSNFELIARVRGRPE